MASAEFDRILLALDACCDVSPVTLQGVVSMAARLNAALEGLFVEDAALMRAAQLPFATEIGRAGRERALSLEALREANRAVSTRVEQLLREAASARNVSWRLSVTEGSRLRAALSAAPVPDLLLPARAAQASRAREHGARPAFGRVGLLSDAPPERALPVIRALAENGHTREVLLLGSAPPPAVLLAELASVRLRTFAQLVVTGEPAAALREAARHGAGLLIGPRRWLEEASAQGQARALDALTLSLLLLR